MAVIHTIIALSLLGKISTTDITEQVFGPNIKGVPAAFGDFNSDELTDLFIIREKSVEVLLSTNEGETVLQSKGISCSFPCTPTSVVPGDFNGDAFLDVLVTTKCGSSSELESKLVTNVIILWGHMNNMNCTNDTTLETIGQPMALDYNDDFITDIMAEDSKGERYVWVFGKNKKFEKIKLRSETVDGKNLKHIRRPHSNAFLDLNIDCIADLFITSGNKPENYAFEIWEGQKNYQERFKPDVTVVTPPRNITITRIGQSLFLDVELLGQMDHILPVTTNKGSALYVYRNETDKWHRFNISLKDPTGKIWEWGYDENYHLLQSITLRGGDFNMDGYPDLLATVMNGGIFTTILLENVACKDCQNFSRTFVVRWEALYPIGNDTAAAVFYDIFQDGVMDVILVYKRGDEFTMGAFKNNLDYDANFVKVMVLSGLQNDDFPFVETPLGKKKRTFGSNLPGPRISYRTVDQEGNSRSGMSAQIPQSAHFALNLPYTTFALGRTPNFVESLRVCFAGQSREWLQIIPNSQIVVIPYPVDSPSQWKVQLFVTPSKAILLTAAALLGTCLVISITIGIMHYREKRNDRLERLQNAYGRVMIWAS